MKLAVKTFGNSLNQSRNSINARFGHDFSVLSLGADLLPHKVSTLSNLAIIEPGDAFKELAQQNEWVNWKSLVLDWTTKTLGEGPAKVLKGFMPFVSTPSDLVEKVCLSTNPLGEEALLTGGQWNPFNWANPAFVTCRALKYGVKAYLQAHGIPWWISQAKDVTTSVG